MWGNWLAMYRNAHVDLKKKKPWTLKDVYPRPEEIQEKEDEGITEEEFIKKAEEVKQAWEKKKAKKKNGSNGTGTTGNKNSGGNSTV